MTATLAVPRARIAPSTSRRQSAEAPLAHDVEANAVTFPSAGDTALAGTWLTPAGRAPSAAVVIVGGAGVAAGAYRRLAHHLASYGAGVLTFDYRGVGASRAGDLRGFHAGAHDWSADVGAALVLAHRRWPDVPLHAVAHGVGAFLLGASPSAVLLDRAVLLGAHAAYHGDYDPRWRRALRLGQHVLLPLVTRLLGYFPARALGLGEDLPAGVALDWAGAREADLLHMPVSRDRFDVTVSRFGLVRAATLAISVSDDALATEAAARRLLACYRAAPTELELVSPAVLGVPNVGHVGFLRSGTGRYFWERTARWLALDAGSTRRTA